MRSSALISRSQRSSFRDTPANRPGHIRRRSNRTIQQHGAGDNDYVVKIYRNSNPASIPRSKSVASDEVAGFVNTPALARQRRTGRRQQQKRGRDCSRLRPESGRRLDRDIAYLDRFVEEQRLLASSEHPGESEEQVPYLRYMSQTGRRVAEMHLALAGSNEFADFTPEPTRPEHVRLWIDDVVARAEHVFDTLKQKRDMLKEADRLLVDQIAAQRAALRDRLCALLPQDIDCLNIRHHGDFHLGQMLIVKDDIFIIDFEGRAAPAAGRTAAQGARGARCRRPDPFNRLFGNRGAGACAQGGADEQGKLGAALAEWRDRAAAAFLDTYHEIMTNQRLWPAHPHAAEQMLNFFLLEKAFYEIEYELAHRPEWLRVPLTGVLRILSQQTQHTNEAS